MKNDKWQMENDESLMKQQSPISNLQLPISNFQPPISNLYLFDMDAVLLYPGGYRAALMATVNYFSREMGLGDCAPTMHEIEVFESVGITSEWDSAPMCIVALMLNGKRVDYAELARRVSAETKSGECPAEAAYRVFHQTSEVLETSEVLLHSRNINRSRVLQVFQQFTLGEQYESTYGLKRTFENGHGSLLLKYDRKVITLPVPERSAIYTARPSKPPRDVPMQIGYAPEAELGAELVGLSHLPLIGFGRLQWLAERVGPQAHGELYIKPSPVHALAAIGAAFGFPESESLLMAEALARGELNTGLGELRGVRVTVFEDSAASIQGVRQAVNLIGGVCVGIGISSGGPKLERLEKISDRVYPSIDEALQGEING
ncbi:MAG: hypothetical protein AABZ78_16015 [Chloroflexota bacterium]